MVRCMFTWSEERNEVISVSRGGKEYDVPTTHLRESDLVKSFLQNNPKLILDGELYVHGWSLQKISGVCRKKTWEKQCSNLEFWIFDIADLKNDFNQRLDTLVDLSIYFEDEPKITVLEHELKEGWHRVKKLHDQFVSEGFEGLVARKPFRPYGAGKRNSDWVKLKDYKEEEFEIVGKADKSRPEDFCFILITKEGKTFEAKPMGTRETRAEYLENWEAYVGEQGTVKFFNWTDENIPSQPIFKNVRKKGE